MQLPGSRAGTVVVAPAAPQAGLGEAGQPGSAGIPPPGAATKPPGPLWLWGPDGLSLSNELRWKSPELQHLAVGVRPS